MAVFSEIKMTEGYKPFDENKILLFSRPKVGKTSLFGGFPKTLIIDCEEGTDHQPAGIAVWKVKSWLEFTGLVGKIKKNIKELTYQRIVIDTATSLLSMCDLAVSERRGVMSVIEADDWGKTGSAYIREFSRQIDTLIHLGLGVCFCCHAEEKSIDAQLVTNPYASSLVDKEGKVTMVVPVLDKKSRLYLNRMVDLIWYLEIGDEGQRILYTKPSKHFEAGGRSDLLPGRVEVPKTGLYDLLLSHYYKGNDQDGDVKAKLIEKLNIAEQYLAQHKIDGFDQPTRVVNSHRKHLTYPKLEDAEIAQLEGYLQHLRIKATNFKKEKQSG
jgi:hypothetical protein